METNDPSTQNPRRIPESDKDPNSIFVESEFEFEDSPSASAGLNPASSQESGMSQTAQQAYVEHYDSPTVEVDYEFEDEVVVAPPPRYYSLPVVSAPVAPRVQQPAPQPVVAAEPPVETPTAVWQPDAVQEPLVSGEPVAEVVAEPEPPAEPTVSVTDVPVYEPSYREQEPVIEVPEVTPTGLDLETIYRVEAETFASDAEKLHAIELISKSLNEELDTLVSLKQKADMLVGACDDARKRENTSKEQIDSLLSTQSRLNSMLETASSAIANNQQTLGVLLSDFEDVVAKLPPGLKADGEQKLLRIKSGVRDLRTAAPPQALGAREEPTAPPEPVEALPEVQEQSELVQSLASAIEMESAEIAAVADAELLSEPAVLEADEDLPVFDFEEIGQTSEAPGFASVPPSPAFVEEFSGGVAADLEMPEFDIDEEFSGEFEPLAPAHADSGVEVAAESDEPLADFDLDLDVEFAEELVAEVAEPVAEVVDEAPVDFGFDLVEQPSFVVEEPVAEVAEPVEEASIDFGVDLVEEPSYSVEEPVAEVAEPVVEAVEEAPVDFGFDIAEESSYSVEEPVASVAEPVAEVVEEAPSDFGFDLVEQPSFVVEEPVAEVAEPVAEAVEEAPVDFGFDLVEQPSFVVEEPVAEVAEPVAEAVEEATVDFGFDVVEQPSYIVKEPVAEVAEPVAEVVEAAPVDFGFDLVEQPSFVVEEPVAEVAEPVAEVVEEAPAEFGFDLAEEPSYSVEEPVAEIAEPVAEAVEEAPSGFEFSLDNLPPLSFDEPVAEVEQPVAEAVEEVPSEFGFDFADVAPTSVEEPVAEIEQPVVEAVEESPSGFDFNLDNLPPLSFEEPVVEPVAEAGDEAPVEFGFDLADVAPLSVEEPVSEIEQPVAEAVEEAPSEFGFDLADFAPISVEEPVAEVEPVTDLDLQIDDGDDYAANLDVAEVAQESEDDIEGQMDIDFSAMTGSTEPEAASAPTVEEPAALDFDLSADLDFESPSDDVVAPSIDSDFDLAELNADYAAAPPQIDYDLPFDSETAAQASGDAQAATASIDSSFDLDSMGLDAPGEVVAAPTEFMSVGAAPAVYSGPRVCPRCGKEQKHSRAACVYCYTQLDVEMRPGQKAAKPKPVRSAVAPKPAAAGEPKKGMFGFLKRSK